MTYKSMSQGWPMSVQVSVYFVFIIEMEKKKKLFTDVLDFDL